MMTPEQKMQKVVEAAGGCWHEWVKKDTSLEHRPVTGLPIEYGGHGYECACGFRRVNRVNWRIGTTAKLHAVNCANPSPTDLNELFRLAGKIGFSNKRFTDLDTNCFQVNIENEVQIVAGLDWKFYIATGRTQTEALLNALYEALS
jgi:hypothetical protein